MKAWKDLNYLGDYILFGNYLLKNMKTAFIPHECQRDASEGVAVHCPSPHGFVFDLKAAAVVAVSVT